MAKQEMHFPVDVMINMLYRLPSISIVRFQAVSKYWCYAIRVSDVLNSRSQSSLRTVQLSTNMVSGKLAHFIFNAKGKIKKSVHNIFNLDDTLDLNFSNMVNDVACAYGNNAITTFYLINLTTFQISEYSKREIRRISIICDRISLGFDPSTGSYKFIRIYSHTKNCTYYCEILETSASSKGSWKIIGEIPFTVDFITDPVFLNGAMHWLMVPRSLNKEKPLALDIVKLDMKEEKFEMVAQFEQYDNQVCSWEHDFALSEEKGKLYVMHWCCQRQILEGWRMKESDRDKGLWNIMFHVNFASMGDKVPWRFIGKDEHAYVVGFVDGKVLIRSKGYDKGVYIYDLAHKQLSSLWDVDCGSFYFGNGLRRMLFYRRPGVNFP